MTEKEHAMSNDREDDKPNHNIDNNDTQLNSSSASTYRYNSYKRNDNNNYNTKHQHNKHQNNGKWSRFHDDGHGNNQKVYKSFRTRGYMNNSRGRGRGRSTKTNHNRFARHYNTEHKNNHNNSYHPSDTSSLRYNHQTNRSKRQLNIPSKSINITSKDIATKCAYATMVINNAEYLSGAFTLAWSLMIAGSKAHRVIIIDEDINTKYGKLIELTGLFDDKLVIPTKLHYTAIQKRWRRYAESGIYNWINTAFNKYYCFTLTKYARVIMLDADQICLQNPDELFLLSAPAGICSFYNELNNTLQNKKHGKKVSNGDIRRSYERQWGMRGCLFMISPSSDVFNDIVSELEYLQIHNNGIGDRSCFLGADEKFLTKYYMSGNGDLDDSDWTHIHTKFSRLSYIDKTTLSEDPYFLHFCTYKPWKSPGNDKWIHEQWEDITIWVFGSASAQLYITKQIPQQYASTIANIMSPDAQFYANVLKQEWSKKYLDFGSKATNICDQDVLLNMYHIMAKSYKEMELRKHNETHDLKQKMKYNETQHNEMWSFDYSKQLLLSALLSENEEQIPDKVIWQFWNTTKDEMTRNIAFCIDSVRNNNRDWKHILVTPINIWKYLNENELPKDVLKFDKWCHVSDVVRVALLAKYGGIYCDATCVCFNNCSYMNFNSIWDKLLMQQKYDFIGFRYDHEKAKWKNDETFCCWFMATKKDNGLFYSWLNKINMLMKGGKTSNAQLQIIDLLYDNNAFKKYVALGPGILDELFEEYVHYHPNFKYKLYDPRDFALLDHLFNYQQLWYLNDKREYHFKDWFQNKKPHFIKLFCAEQGTQQLYKTIKDKLKYLHDDEVTLNDIMDSGLIIADIFALV